MNHKSKEDELEHNDSISIWNPSSLCNSQPTDLILVIESWKFHVHKNIIEKSSDYFSAMFSAKMIESAKDVIDLHLVDPEQFRILIEGMYTGHLELTEDNVFGVAQVGQMLQICASLQCKYIDFMKHNLINLKHSLELMYFCIPLNMQELYYDVRRFCLAHFSELRHSSSLVNLSVSELYDYLSDEHLVVEHEVHVVEAIHNWLCANKRYVSINTQEYDNLQTQVKKIVSTCVNVKDSVDAHNVVMEAVFKDGLLPVEYFQLILTKRARQEDLFMFWALLKSTNADGLVDIVRLCLDTGVGIKIDTMTDIVEKPGFQLGSALCASGPCVYLSGGGPSFGKANWIRQIWKFDVSQLSPRWTIVGDLIEFRRSHAMVILDNKLYTFGGFGKHRILNSQLDCLDLLTGNWETLSPMPVHELNPLTTVCDNKIFYISKTWKVYSFSISTKDWSELNVWQTFCHMHRQEAKPVALFPVTLGGTDCFAIVTLTDTSLKILLLHREAMTLYTKEEDIASTYNPFTYAGSVAVNGKLVVFLTSEKTEDTAGYRESEVSNLQRVVIFDPSTNLMCDLPDVQNVRKAQSLIALPHLPTTFTMRAMGFS